MRLLILDENAIINKHSFKSINEIQFTDLTVSLHTLHEMDRVILKFKNKFKILKDRYSYASFLGETFDITTIQKWMNLL